MCVVKLYVNHWNKGLLLAEIFDGLMLISPAPLFLRGALTKSVETGPSLLETKTGSSPLEKGGPRGINLLKKQGTVMLNLFLRRREDGVGNGGMS